MRREEGQALVEFALVLPILAALLFGVVELARAYSYWNDTQQLSNVGARYLAVGKNAPGSGTFAENLRAMAETDELRTGGTGPGVKSPGLAVCVAAFTTTGTRTTTPAIGDAVTVRVSAGYKWMDVLGIGPDSVLTGRATMRIEKELPAGVLTTFACPVGVTP